MMVIKKMWRLSAVAVVAALSVQCSGPEASAEDASEGMASNPSAIVDNVPQAAPADVASPEALVAAIYSTLQRAPGERIDWQRFASFHLPGAVLVPNLEQTEGQFQMFSVADFEAWVEGFFEHAPIGSADDHGLKEDEIGSVIHRYGDIAQVMSAYERRAWDSDVVDGRGINAMTLVMKDGRWWILSVAWDEESGAGPIPEAYLGSD